MLIHGSILIIAAALITTGAYILWKVEHQEK